MDQRTNKIIYGTGWALVALIRIPARWRARTNQIIVDRKTVQERSVLAVLFVGMVALPLVYIFNSVAEFRQ